MCCLPETLKWSRECVKNIASAPINSDHAAIFCFAWFTFSQPQLIIFIFVLQFENDFCYRLSGNKMCVLGASTIILSKRLGTICHPASGLALLISVIVRWDVTPCYSCSSAMFFKEGMKQWNEYKPTSRSFCSGMWLCFWLQVSLYAVIRITAGTFCEVHSEDYYRFVPILCVFIFPFSLARSWSCGFFKAEVCLPLWVIGWYLMQPHATKEVVSLQYRPCDGGGCSPTSKTSSVYDQLVRNYSSIYSTHCFPHYQIIR